MFITLQTGHCLVNFFLGCLIPWAASFHAKRCLLLDGILRCFFVVYNLELRHYTAIRLLHTICWAETPLSRRPPFAAVASLCHGSLREIAQGLLQAQYFWATHLPIGLWRTILNSCTASFANAVPYYYQSNVARILRARMQTSVVPSFLRIIQV